VAEAIEYEQFEASADRSAVAGTADMRRLSEIPMELSVEIGRTHMTVGETLDLRPGTVVPLERRAGEPVQLLVNGSPIALGEVVVVDEQYGLRITEIIDAGAQDEGTAGVAEAAAGAPADSAPAAEAEEPGEEEPASGAEA
jgi:flagellar motor switch protein FliN